MSHFEETDLKISGRKGKKRDRVYNLVSDKFAYYKSQRKTKTIKPEIRGHRLFELSLVPRFPRISILLSDMRLSRTNPWYFLPDGLAVCLIFIENSKLCEQIRRLGHPLSTILTCE